MVLSMGPVGRLFSRDKVIDSRVLNLMGAQVFRTLVARFAYNTRHVTVTEAVAKEVAELRREGMVVLPDFLPPDRFERVRAECAWLDGQRDQMETSTHGSSILEVFEIRNFSDDVLPSIYEFYDDPRLRGIVTAAEQWPLDGLAQYGKREYLTQKESSGEVDPQTELHSDIFFNTHKAWFYLDDVRREHGPLVYVKGSHRVTLARLLFMYRDSWLRDPASDPSRRISPEEQRRLEVEETVVTCPRNTLVVVNACGYHRRLPGRPGRKRCALHLSVRTDPFAARGIRSRLARYPGVYSFLRRSRQAWRGRP